MLKNANIFIGGEHFFSPNILFKKSEGYIDSLIRDFKDDYEVNFTFGGHYSLLAIINAIKPSFDKNSVILLPSYLCPSILEPFKSSEIKYRFFKIDENLFVDIDYLSSIIDDNVKAILFIDYFGASQMDHLKPVLETLKAKKIIVIQDVVQCLQISRGNLFGDYIFNSFRKFFPFEGSILLSNGGIEIKFCDKKSKFIIYKRIGQLLRYFHVKYNLFSSNQFLWFFKKAEDYYGAEDILRMPKCNKRQLNKYNSELLVERQKFYYGKLYKVFGEIVPELLKNDSFIPLGFVIKINQRDQVRKNLFKQNIFLPIHWLLSEELDKSLFNKSVELSSVILTIPLVGLTNKAYCYLFSNIIKYIKQ